MNFFQVLLLATGLAAGSAAVINQPDICSSYIKAVAAYAECNAKLDASFLDTPLPYAENMCSNRTSIRACMLMKVIGCPNSGKIMDGVDVTFNKCDRLEVKYELRKYLRGYVREPKGCGKSYNFSSAATCLGADEFASTLIESSYSEGVVTFQSFVSRVPLCLRDFLLLDPVPGCDGKSGFDLYLDTLAVGSSLFLLGVDLYGEFENAVQFLI